MPFGCDAVEDGKVVREGLCTAKRVFDGDAARLQPDEGKRHCDAVVAEGGQDRVFWLCGGDEDAVLLFKLNNLTNDIRTSASYRCISREDILSADTELADAGMTRRIRITTDEGDVLLNAQHESTSGLRTSGLWGSWHAANLPRACDEICRMGSGAKEAM